MYTDHEIAEAEHGAWFAARLKDSPARNWILTVDGLPIGLIGLTDLAHGRGSMAFYIGEAEYRGKGYGVAGLSLVLGKAFGELRLRKVWAEVLADNAPAVRLYERRGFTRQAHLVAHVVKNGQPIDVIGLGLVADAWAASSTHIAA
jgi:UDP-4-amino-4,6-dideoxy-N-acetyl-beta-L-altrosamine N-acetyltransferase